jgi:hypothetical protein
MNVDIGTIKRADLKGWGPGLAVHHLILNWSVVGGQCQWLCKY